MDIGKSTKSHEDSQDLEDVCGPNKRLDGPHHSYPLNEGALALGIVFPAKITLKIE